MIGWTWLAVAQAVEPDLTRYPLRADVELPPTGIARIHLPLALRSAADPADGSDVLLVNGGNQVIPLARAGTDPEPQRWFGSLDDGSAELGWSPTANPDRTNVAVRGRPVDVLLVQLLAESAATATVRDERGELLSAPVLVWNMEGQEQIEVPLTRSTNGNLVLDLVWHRERVGIQVGGQVHANRVPVERWTVQTGGPALQENGWARYDVVLDAIVPVHAIELRPTEELFDRSASLTVPSPGIPTAGLVDDGAWPMDAGMRIRRLQLGGVQIEQVRLIGGWEPTDRFALLVSGDPAPLTIPEVVLEARGAVLLVKDPGPGPFVLYGGAVAGTSPAWDLQSAAADLERLAGPAIEPGPVGENGAYVPVEVSSGLGAPGAEVSLRAMKWARTVSGAAGLARIPLDVEVLAHARADLADLRLVDAQNRQIPYVLRSHGAEVSWGTLPMTRKEDGSRSLLTVELPHDNVIVSSLSVRATADDAGRTAPFSRTVTVSRPAGARLEPVRMVQWDGLARAQLTVQVNSRFADRLTIEIENGDNPPIGIDGVDLRWPQWELLAVLPEEPGARLVYGDFRQSAPDYDFASLVGPLSRRPPAGTLGAEEALTAPPLSASDRILLAVSLAAFAAGLGWVLLGALRAVPDPASGPIV